MTVAIENEGKPITAEQEKHLFERFYKADDPPRRMRFNPAPVWGCPSRRTSSSCMAARSGSGMRTDTFTFTVRLPNR
ncbi:hypothetical protein O0V01_15535 [Paenibacillus thiaminolyticus]|nr:hypothetical protein [Paenibacillus thiaminolyticus]WII35128.1 hypothetical protein O0V01_15535 [Paenibacillus thiaminolyticus]